MSMVTEYGSVEQYRARVRERGAQGEPPGIASVHCSECWPRARCCSSCVPLKRGWAKQLVAMLGMGYWAGESLNVDGMRKVLSHD